MNGAEYIIQALQQAGVSTLFGYPGGAIMPVYDALYDSQLDHILCRHEQGAALAAEAYARSSGKLGVCLATSGPGATNLLTGIANAYLDSIPLLFITGQVASPLIGTDAFQEVDILGMSIPVVKHNYLVKNIQELPRILEEAMVIAQSGRPGPVLIDVPKDIQLAQIVPLNLQMTIDDPVCCGDESIRQAKHLIAQSQRPVLYSGGGVVLADAVERFRAFSQETGIPSVVTLKGLGNDTEQNPNYLGMLGMHGTKAANLAVQGCDLLICVGARFDDRVTGKLDTFAPKAKVIHLDIDAAEFGKLRQPDIILHGDLKHSLKALSQKLDISPWQQHCQTLRQTHCWRYDHPGESIYAPALIKELGELVFDNTIITTDVGQHQMWVAQHYPVHHPRQFLSSGGLGTMGFGLPAAIGAQFAKPDSTVICFSGDGSIMMNIQELATVNRYRLPIKIIIFDNHRLGMVKQWQELFFTERYSSVELNDNPDFVAVANAFNIPALHIKHKNQIKNALQTLLSAPGAFLLHVEIDPQQNVWPLVPPGAANSEMMECTKNATV